jgi:hypothetical protein
MVLHRFLLLLCFVFSASTWSAIPIYQSGDLVGFDSINVMGKEYDVRFIKGRASDMPQSGTEKGINTVQAAKAASATLFGLVAEYGIPVVADAKCIRAQSCWILTPYAFDYKRNTVDVYLIALRFNRGQTNFVQGKPKYLQTIYDAGEALFSFKYQVYAQWLVSDRDG